MVIQILFSPIRSTNRRRITSPGGMVDLPSPQVCGAKLGDLLKGYVYIITNQYNEVLYIGATNDLVRRITEHRLGIIKGFSTKYNLKKLVYYEEFASIGAAFLREKKLKKCIRQYKLDLIGKFNPNWIDLYSNVVNENIIGDPQDSLCELEDV